MSQHPGFAIAATRIAEEAEAKTGFLDLGNLGLTALPDSLWSLTHLRELNLGSTIQRADGAQHEADGNLGPNRLNDLLTPIDRLVILERLSCSGTYLDSAVPFARLSKLQELDVSNTGITDLTPLAGLPSLQSLTCFDTKITDLTPLAGLASLQSLNCSGTGITDLTPLASLASLQSLDCSNTEITDLTPLAGLASLQSLNCSGTGITDLTPLASLASLQSLDCSNTEITDLTPLARLASLQSLNCFDTGITDLTPLARLASLQSLTCSSTGITDLTPLARLASLQSLTCSSTGITDLTPLARLASLQSLNCASTGITDLTPLASLASLQSLDCSNTEITDLTPLAGLPSLQSLTCSYTGITDLTPLAGLPSLQSLNCFNTKITDLTPLAGLPSLQSLNCFNTKITDLTPLAGLAGLQSLNCYDTKVTDLTPLAGLASLQSLNCSGTGITDLTPLARLASLQSLYCSSTGITDLTPLAGLATLQSIDCSDTAITDLTPLAGLASLQSLECSTTKITGLMPLAGLATLQSIDCSDTAITDLSPLAGLASLQSLDCSGTGITDLTPLAGVMSLQRLTFGGKNIDLIPLKDHRSLWTLNLQQAEIERLDPSFWFNGSLVFVSVNDSTIAGIDPDVLPEDFWENALPAIRAHLNDIAAGAPAQPDTKLLVLGNGRAGKTQLIRALRHEPYDPASKSTHGVIITHTELADTIPPTRLQIWDFGGQDIYHGTHALFLRTRAIFALVWAATTENTTETTHEGHKFRNHPLSYWLHFANHLGSPGSPKLVVQTQADSPAQNLAAPLPTGAPALQTVRFSAQTRRGLLTLRANITEAVNELHAAHPPEPIGKGRLRVQRELEARRTNGVRLLDNTEFEAICAEGHGDISSPAELRRWLHNIGTIFHLFDDRIVLDQSWALEAVYAVFNRDDCFAELKANRGRFTRRTLAALVWHEHNEEQQRLFLSMMRAVGICFPVLEGNQNEGTETRYIAPDLLPARHDLETEIEAQWINEAETASATFAYAFLHPGIIRAITARIGTLAGVHATYWRTGLCLYDRQTRSHALIEATEGPDWSGTITLQTQHGDRLAFRSQLAEWIEEESRKQGLTPTEGAWSPPRTPGDPRPHGATSLKAEPENPAPDPGPAPRNPAWYVSYAWGDDKSPEGIARETAVNDLIEAATNAGHHIVRDVNATRSGDSIDEFMARIADADRIFLLLSPRYLESAFCMRELHEVWRTSKGNPAVFKARTRAYIIKGTPMRNAVDRAECAAAWKVRHDKLDAVSKLHGAGVLGHSGLTELNAMARFSTQTADILHAIADTIGVTDFQTFLDHGFKD